MSPAQIRLQEIVIAARREPASAPDPVAVREAIRGTCVYTLRTAVEAGHIAPGWTIGDLLAAFGKGMEVRR